MTPTTTTARAQRRQERLDRLAALAAEKERAAQNRAAWQRELANAYELALMEPMPPGGRYLAVAERTGATCAEVRAAVRGRQAR